MGNSIGVVIQARTGSSRLHGKVLMPLQKGDTILSYLVKRISSLGIQTVVATTTSEKDDELAVYLSSNNIPYVRGSEDDVLSRFVLAADYFNLNYIIRICADSPFIDKGFLSKLIKIWEQGKKKDYLSFSYQGKPTVLSHFGVFGEIVSVEALKKLASTFPENDFYKEHVTNGIYTNADMFSIELFPFDDVLAPYDGLRFTVDTLSDYEVIKNISSSVNVEEVNFETIADWAIQQPGILNNMRDNITNNKK